MHDGVGLDRLPNADLGGYETEFFVFQSHRSSLKVSVRFSWAVDLDASGFRRG